MTARNTNSRIAPGGSCHKMEANLQSSRTEACQATTCVSRERIAVGVGSCDSAMQWQIELRHAVAAGIARHPPHRAHQSTATPYVFRRRISGARYSGVPQIDVIVSPSTPSLERLSMWWKNTED